MEMDVRALNALIPVFDFVGIVAFALSGVFEGIKRRIDPVGVFIVAFSTAFGGGMLRDILIDRRPFTGSITKLTLLPLSSSAWLLRSFINFSREPNTRTIGTSLPTQSVLEFSVFQELRFRSQPECPGCLPSSSDASPVFSAV